MTIDGKTVVHIQVSSGLFELVTDCLRLYSVEVRQLATLNQLVTTALETWDASDSDPQSLCDHLAALPAGGTIPISFVVQPEISKAHDRVSAKVARLLARPPDNAEILSLLLFCYLVERRTKAALKAMAAQLVPSDIASHGAENVFPFSR